MPSDEKLKVMRELMSKQIKKYSDDKCFEKIHFTDFNSSIKETR